MDISFLIKGFIIGLSIAAPVGPIGVLCIRRTLTNGRLSGLVSGLGAATADGFYGMVAAFGLTIISRILVEQQFWIRLIGSLFLFYLGIKTFLSKPVEEASPDKKKKLFSFYITTFFLTITNPMTILSFAAIFAGFGLGSGTSDFSSGAIMVLGVFSGSVFWWIILSSGVSILKSKFNTNSLKIVNRISGIIIVSFAVYALAGIL